MAALAGPATMAAAGLATAAPAGAVPVHSLAPGGHAIKNSTTAVFNYTGPEQTFTVRSEVTSIDVIAIGAAGGNGGAVGTGSGGGTGGADGSGTGTVEPLAPRALRAPAAPRPRSAAATSRPRARPST